MSKLIEHIQVYETNERKYLPKPLKMVESEFTAYQRPDDYAIVYRVVAKLGAQVIISQEEKLQGNWQILVKNKVYRPLAEEIFGEFRQPLIDADLAIAQGEYIKASKLIREVLDGMFKV